jgi:chromosome condensin MukBEF ATPase and DNA-binding subunit MukB
VLPQALQATTHSHLVQSVQKNLADELSAAQDRVDVDGQCAALDEEVAWLTEALQDRCSQLEESRAAFGIQTEQLQQAVNMLANNVPTPAQAAGFASEVRDKSLIHFVSSAQTLQYSSLPRMTSMPWPWTRSLRRIGSASRCETNLPISSFNRRKHCKPHIVS